MENIFKSIEETIAVMFHSESSGHDIHHLKRVFNVALHIQSVEGGDLLVIGAAALVHDIHRLIEKETGKFCPPKDSLDKVKEVLLKVQFPVEKIEKVLHCVEFHEEYGFSEKGKTVDDIETLILQDADNLDAIGAIGIGRAFSFDGMYGVVMWDPEKDFDRTAYDDSKHDSSTIQHFYSKLLKLKDNMSTATGKKMAQGRHDFMELYLKQFFAEWKGEA